MKHRHVFRDSPVAHERAVVEVELGYHLCASTVTTWPEHLDFELLPRLMHWLEWNTAWTLCWKGQAFELHCPSCEPHAACSALLEAA